MIGDLSLVNLSADPAGAPMAREQRTTSAGWDCSLARKFGQDTRSRAGDRQANLSMSLLGSQAPLMVTVTTGTHPLQSTNLDSSPTILITASCFEQMEVPASLGFFCLLTSCLDSTTHSILHLILF